MVSMKKLIVATMLFSTVLFVPTAVEAGIIVQPDGKGKNISNHVNFKYCKLNIYKCLSPFYRIRKQIPITNITNTVDINARTGINPTQNQPKR